MPGLDGFQVTRRLAPHTNVVVVTTFDYDEYLHTALDNGASDFLTKDAGPGLLVESVRAAARGDVLVSQQVVQRVLGRHSRRTPEPDTEPLTSREEDVVRLVARGLGNQEIGAGPTRTAVSTPPVSSRCR